jgi:hypothetical protein
MHLGKIVHGTIARFERICPMQLLVSLGKSIQTIDHNSTGLAGSGMIGIHKTLGFYAHSN